MSFRLRLTVLASLAVAVALVGASFAIYYADRAELIRQTDVDLTATRALLPPFHTRSVTVGRRPGGVLTPAQRLLAPGTHQIVLPRLLKAVQVKISKRKAVPGAAKPASFSTETIGQVHSRVLTLFTANRKVLISTSLVDVDRNLTHLRWLLLFISIGGIGAAAVLGGLVSGRAVAPLRRLAEATERIVRTGDLSERTGQRGRDEVSRLSARLDELLGTLDGSLRTQRQLVADASHELRTPIATLRANFELLAAPERLDAETRAEVAADVRDELESITSLVGELLELARGEELEVAPSEFRLDDVVKSAVERAARRGRGVTFRTRLEPTVVSGVPERVERAVANLLDNARKWSPAYETVDVAVHDGVVEVRDRGPGIATEDLPLIFNRFYRSAKARGMPGAGLGLAIVKQIADAHGGTVTVDQAPDGGAILRLRLSPTR